MAKRASHVRTKANERVILEGISVGTPLLRLCRENDFSKSEIYRWLEEDAEFAGRFARARVEGFDAIADEAMDIADDNTKDTLEGPFGPYPDKEWIARSKLRVETRLKLLAKWDPKRYGDKLDINHGGQAGKPIETVAMTAQEAAQRYKDEIG